MQVIKFINDIGEVSVGNAPPFILSKIRGAGEVDVDITTSKGYMQDGKTIKSILLDEKEISIEGAVYGSSKMAMYENRKHLCKIFNPKYEGELIYNNDYLIKKIKCVPEKGIKYGERKGNYQTFKLSLVGYEPFWLDNFKTIKKMSYLMGGLSFPLRLPTQFSQRAYKRVFINDGDLSTPLEIDFHGPATNPIVKNNTTDKFIKVNRSIGEGEVLHIDTTFGNKKVEIISEDGSRTNAMHWIDLESKFFSLKVGKNEIEYNSNNDSKKTKVIIHYSQRYVGV